MEIVVVSVVARISHDWVGVKSTACLAYALHEHLNVQDKKNEGKNRRDVRRCKINGCRSCYNCFSGSCYHYLKCP
uniref:Uncharacterized protein n=1 Tax=Solanum lycopersicum TaxID=4081 RepID=K4CK12_SOLLC